MAIHWHWAFGNETPTVLQNSMGFAFTNLASFVQDSTNPYTYSGAPTKYSMKCSATSSRVMTLPDPASPGAVGAISIAIRGDTLPSTERRIISVNSTDVALIAPIYIRSNGLTNSVSLYIDNVFKESTGPIDWYDWRYLTLKWDMSTATWSGQIYIDGVAATSLQTDAATAITTTEIQLGGFTNVTDTYIGQIIVHDNTSDTSQNPKFVTRIDPNADGTNTGTWVPQSGLTDYEMVDSPLDSSTYTEVTTPAGSDRVEVLTNSGAADLNTLLGTTTVNIDSVCVHAIASGQTITAKALVGDGTSETAGSNFSVGASSSYDVAVANTKPSSGDWAGTDSPTFVFEVVST